MIKQNPFFPKTVIYFCCTSLRKKIYFNIKKLYPAECGSLPTSKASCTKQCEAISRTMRGTLQATC